MCGTFSFAPPGLVGSSLGTTHGLRRGLHSCAASRLSSAPAFVIRTNPVWSAYEMALKQELREVWASRSLIIFRIPPLTNAVTDVTTSQILWDCRHQIGKLTHFSNYPLQFFSFIWYKQSTESSVCG